MAVQTRASLLQKITDKVDDIKDKVTGNDEKAAENGNGDADADDDADKKEEEKGN